ncbi:hypothetical protein ACP3Q8_02455, partial [Escherichia coli]|uniref:hypothetical protein n=1 Tax=Escherichia coli TaxID=562 RepID=UPI003CEAC1D6
GGFFTPRHHALTRSPPHKTARIHTNAPANNLNAITTRSDAEKIKSAPPPARSAFPASPARFMERF